MLSVQGDGPTPYLRISEINVKAKRAQFCRPQRRCARGFERYLAPENQRARGRPGARCTRGLAGVLQKDMLPTSIQVQR